MTVTNPSAIVWCEAEGQDQETNKAVHPSDEAHSWMSSLSCSSGDGSLYRQLSLETVKKTAELGSVRAPDQLFIQEKRQSRARLLPQVLASLTLAIAAMIEGYSAGYTSPALASMTRSGSSIPVDDQQASWIGSLMPLNALVGAITGGTIIERYGRKKALMATGPPYILGNFHYTLSCSQVNGAVL